MRGNLFIISSPSGGGKGTLIKRVLASVPNLSYSVSFTTRDQRPGEVDGKDYNFVSKDEFEELIENDEFLEYANVHGNYYGTSKKIIEKETAKGNDVILEIDVQGAELIRQKTHGSVGIFILPPSYSILRQRLEARNTESETVLTLRLENAGDEVARFDEFDFAVINDELDVAVESLKSIIISERHRCDRQIEGIRDILTTFDDEL